MDDLQEKRIARNEARFRELNDAIARGVERFRAGSGDGTFEAVCECAIADCLEMLDLDFDTYSHVRSDATWFVVRPDHVVTAVEQPVEQHDAYWIIEKRGLGAKVAADLA